MQPSNIDGIDILRVRLSAETRKLMKIHNISDACARGDSSHAISAMIEKEKQLNKDVNQWKTCDVFGRNAFHYSCMKGRPSVIQV